LESWFEVLRWSLGLLGCVVEVELGVGAQLWSWEELGLRERCWGFKVGQVGWAKSRQSGMENGLVVTD
jgi:hypothetical protein